VAVETVEHCLAAVAGLQIDNVQIELSGSELPGCDGSSMAYVEALQQAGKTPQAVEQEIVRITEPVRVSEGDADIVALPGANDCLDILYDLDYGPDNPIGRQIYSLNLTEESFIAELASARTFLMESEARQFQAAGMGAHLTTKDVLVIGEHGPLDNDYRYSDECVRHKILDLIGDLMLLGCPIHGRIIARKSGHALNHQLVRGLSDQVTAHRLVGQTTGDPVLDINAIQRILPHRYPMLLVDRVIEFDGDRRAVGIKNVTINEPFFQGHYPQHPIMPGVIVVEAMAQLAGLLLSRKLEHTGKLAVLLSMDRVKMRRPVVPGDQLVLEAETVRVKSRTGHVFCRSKVGKTLAAEAIIKFMLVDADPV
jgi:UDP-3-O-[3-hydroxymyristoyl] N-acetylglucosamine deacetylase/3-hydroxyacyl-[acyl-carrier-protein] dehydratase